MEGGAAVEPQINSKRVSQGLLHVAGMCPSPGPDSVSPSVDNTQTAASYPRTAIIGVFRLPGYVVLYCIAVVSYCVALCVALRFAFLLRLCCVLLHCVVSRCAAVVLCCVALRCGVALSGAVMLCCRGLLRLCRVALRFRVVLRSCCIASRSVAICEAVVLCCVVLRSHRLERGSREALQSGGGRPTSIISPCNALPPAPTPVN